MAKAKQIVKGKVLKKEWFPIKSTNAFDSTHIGEGYVTDPEMLLDRHLTINLANLTGDIRQQGISLHFRILSIDDGAGVASVIGYEASSSQLKRLVRRGVERLDDSIECKTSDGSLIRVKPFAVTKSSASKYKIRLMRALMRKALSEEVSKQDFDTLVKAVIANKLQISIKATAKKIFPLRAFEIRMMQVVTAPNSPTPQPAEAASEHILEEQTEEPPEKEKNARKHKAKPGSETEAVEQKQPEE